MKKLERLEQLDYLEQLETSLKKGIINQEECNQFEGEINSGVLLEWNERNPYIYGRIIISNQLWMNENLKVSNFRNGDVIQEAKSKQDWERFFRDRIPAWSYYQYEPSVGKIFGKLYNRHAVNDPRGLAPKGWHIPTDEEWKVLAKNLGGTDIAGGAMKSTIKTGSRDIIFDIQSAIGVTGWTIEDVGSTNSSGFNALPGGILIAQTDFMSIGKYGKWWSSSANDRGSLIYYGVTYLDTYLFSTSGCDLCCLSVRCIKDYTNNVSWV